MSKADASSGMGVGLEARKVAEDAARRSGLSVGGWLDKVIAGGAPQRREDDEAATSADRLEAVTAQLARRSPAAASEGGRDARQRDWQRLRERTQSLRSSLSRDTQEQRAAELSAKPSREPSPERGRGGGRDAPAPSLDHMGSPRSETLGTEASSDTGLARAPDSARRSDGRDLATVERVASASRKVEQRELLEAEDLGSDGGRLGQRAMVSDRRSDSAADLERQPMTRKRPDAAAPEPARAGAKVAAGADAGRADHFAKLEAKLASILETFDRAPEQAPRIALGPPAAAGRPGAAELPPPSRDRPASTGAAIRVNGGPSSRSALDAAVAEIARRQRKLEEAGEPVKRDQPSGERQEPVEAGRREQGVDLRAFDQRLEAIAGRIERAADLANAKSQAEAPVPGGVAFDMLRDEIARLGSRLERMREPAPHPDIQLLRQEVADMSRALGEMASGNQLAALAGAVHDLTARIEVSREEGVRESLLAPIEHIAADLREVLKDIDPRRTADSLGHEIGVIAAKLDQMATQGFDRETFARIHDQTQEIRDLLTVAIQQPMPLDRIERQIAALAARLDKLAAQTAAQPSLADMAGADLRALLAEALPAEPYAALEARVETLAGKIEDMLSRPSADASFAALNERIERVQSALQQQSAKVPDTRQLETMILRLAETVERAQQHEGDAAAFEALEAQIATIAARLERSDGQASAIGSLEHTIGDLFGRLEEARQAAIEAAEMAARTAAREALREQLASTHSAPAMDTISREIVQLRSAQDDADRRIEATLGAVHEALEKVVDRLATREDGRGRAAPVAPEVELISRELVDLRSARDETDRTIRETLSTVHEALEKVVDRLAFLEKAPEAATARGVSADKRAPRREHRSPFQFMLGRGKEATAEAAAKPPAVAPAREPMELSVDEPDFLIEPGSGFAPRRQASPARRSDAPEAPVKTPAEPAPEASAQSSFIAAARRAAQAAAAEAAVANAGRVRPANPARAAQASQGGKAAAGPAEQLRVFVNNRKRPILLALAGLVIALGAYEVARGISAPHEAAPDQSQSPPPPLDAPKRTSETDVGAPDAPAAVASAQGETDKMSVPVTAAAQPFDTNPTGSVGPSPSSFAPPVPPPPAALPQDTNAQPAVLPLREAAVAGNAGAQYELGMRLADGRQMGRDPRAAVDWFGRAAAQGLAPAEFRLGVIYEKGLGVAQDLPLAKAWYQKAAEAGHTHAMHNLAVVLAEGAGGKPNYAEAAAWFHKAAEFGIRDSQYNLAILYARGLGIEQDLSQSYIWFSLAANQGDEDAGKKRDEVGKRLDAGAIATAKAVVDAFQPKTADRAANEVAAPPGGWDPLPKPEVKGLGARPKVSSL